MSDPLILTLATLAGGLLGAIFFGGLWWTIRRGVSSPRPALWFLGSFVLRMAVVLVGFYFVGHGRWERFLACLLGFLAARFAVLRLSRHSPPTPAHPAEEGSHESQS